MDKPDMSAFIECDREYTKLSGVLEKKYRCRWDDKVHDSFALYNNMIRRCAGKISKSKQDAEKIQRKIEMIEAQNIIEKCRDLCTEAESV